MPGACIVPNCRSGTYSDLKKSRDSNQRPKSLFYVPKCPILLRKWQECLGVKDKTLTPKNRVCEGHFNDKDVIKNDETRLADGTIYRIPRQVCKLRDGAIPIAIPKTDHTYVKINVTDSHTTLEQDITTRDIQIDNDGTIGSMGMMSQEVITSSHSGQGSGQVELVVDGTEKSAFLAVEQLLLYSYTFVRLKEDLFSHKLIMPHGWAYIFEDAFVKFTQVHPRKYVIRIFCIINRNMRVQIATLHSRPLDVNEQFSTSTDVVNYLNKLAVTKCCDGTGIESSYSENCHGFILSEEDLYKRSRGYQRCMPCRRFREIQLTKKQNLENVETRIYARKRKIKALYSNNAYLKKKAIAEFLTYLQTWKSEAKLKGYLFIPPNT